MFSYGLQHCPHPPGIFPGAHCLPCMCYSKSCLASAHAVLCSTVPASRSSFRTWLGDAGAVLGSSCGCCRCFSGHGIFERRCYSRPAQPAHPDRKVGGHLLLSRCQPHIGTRGAYGNSISGPHLHTPLIAFNKHTQAVEDEEIADMGLVNDLVLPLIINAAS